LEVYYTQSLSEAGGKLGKTTSSVSKDITKLREQFDDALFIGSNNKMLPTEYVKNIAPEIEKMLSDIRHTLTSKSSISSEHYRKPIKVAVTHVLMELYDNYPNSSHKPALSYLLGIQRRINNSKTRC
jgi:DNA-binding transcriptional LysR family regulator